ncbi:VirK family protein [Xanthomonas translucens]
MRLPIPPSGRWKPRILRSTRSLVNAGAQPTLRAAPTPKASRIRRCADRSIARSPQTGTSVAVAIELSQCKPGADDATPPQARAGPRIGPCRVTEPLPFADADTDTDELPTASRDGKPIQTLLRYLVSGQPHPHPGNGGRCAGPARLQHGRVRPPTTSRAAPRSAAAAHSTSACTSLPADTSARGPCAAGTAQGQPKRAQTPLDSDLRNRQNSRPVSPRWRNW